MSLINNHKIEDLYKQFNIDTATWGLDIWEDNLQLTGGSGLSLMQRRARIKTKLRGSSKVDLESLKTIIQDYYNNEVFIEFNGTIKINLPLEGFSYRQIERVEALIKETRPAHLECEISYYTRYTEAETYLGAASLFGEEITVGAGESKGVL